MEKLSLETYNKYYSRLDVLFEIIKTMKGREVAFFRPDANFRGIKAHNISYLQNNMKGFHFNERITNIYNSVASVFNMPMFSYAPDKRSEQYAFFAKNFKNYFTDYDFCFDFDNKDSLKECHNETGIMKDLLDEYNVPYYIKFSGNGFHIVISGEIIEASSPMDKLKNINYYGTYLADFYGLQTMDASIYDIRRVLKTPYSLDFKSGNVALPLSDEEFKDFDLNLVKPENVMKMDLKYRGLLTRKGTKEGFKKFVNEVIYD